MDNLRRALERQADSVDRVIRDALTEAVTAGGDLMRHVIAHDSPPDSKDTARVDTGHMLESVAVHPAQMTSDGVWKASFGWDDPEKYFLYQEYAGPPSAMQALWRGYRESLDVLGEKL